MKSRIKSLEASMKPQDQALSVFFVCIQGDEDEQPTYQTATFVWPTGEAMRLEGMPGETSDDFKRRAQALEGLDFMAASKLQSVPLHELPHHLIPDEPRPTRTVRVGG
jgi:hypothetical protein